VHGLRLDRLLEPLVQLVVERAFALHRRDVLRDAREIERPVVGNVERAHEVRGELLGAVEAEHGDDPPREQRFEHVALPVGHPRGAGCRDPGLVAQDLRLQLLQLRAGLDPELLDEAHPRRLVGVERLRLPAGAVEREHQQAPEGLAQRVLADERVELADDVAVAAELEVGVDPLLERNKAQLLQPVRVRLRPCVEGELGERRAAPEAERLAERAPLGLGVGRTRLAQQPLEAHGVDPLALDVKHVAG
jgi:hypothetical protein